MLTEVSEASLLSQWDSATGYFFGCLQRETRPYGLQPPSHRHPLPDGLQCTLSRLLKQRQLVG